MKYVDIDPQLLSTWDGTSTELDDVEQNNGLMGDIGTDLKQGLAGIKQGTYAIGDLIARPFRDENDVTFSERLKNADADEIGSAAWERRKQAEYSAARQQSEQDYDNFVNQGDSQLERFGRSAVGMVLSPRAGFGRVVQSVPTIATAALPGGVAGAGARAVGGLTARGVATAARVGAAAGEGALSASGNAYNLINSNVENGRGRYDNVAAASAITGLGVAATGYGLSKVGGGIEAALFNREARETTKATVNGWKPGLAHVGKGFAGEGAEEFVQGGFETIPQNLAEGKPWNEDLGQNLGEGLMAGGAMGAAFHASQLRSAGKQELMGNANEPQRSMAVPQAAPRVVQGTHATDEGAVKLPTQGGDNSGYNLGAPNPYQVSTNAPTYGAPGAGVPATPSVPGVDAASKFRDDYQLDYDGGWAPEGYGSSPYDVSTRMAADIPSDVYGGIADLKAKATEANKIRAQDNSDVTDYESVFGKRETSDGTEGKTSITYANRFRDAQQDAPHIRSVGEALAKSNAAVGRHASADVLFKSAMKAVEGTTDVKGAVIKLRALSDRSTSVVNQDLYSVAADYLESNGKADVMELMQDRTAEREYRQVFNTPIEKSVSAPRLKRWKEANQQARRIATALAQVNGAFELGFSDETILSIAEGAARGKGKRSASEILRGQLSRGAKPNVKRDELLRQAASLLESKGKKTADDLLSESNVSAAKVEASQIVRDVNEKDEAETKKNIEGAIEDADKLVDKVNERERKENNRTMDAVNDAIAEADKLVETVEKSEAKAASEAKTTEKGGARSGDNAKLPATGKDAAVKSKGTTTSEERPKTDKSAVIPVSTRKKITSAKVSTAISRFRDINTKPEERDSLLKDIEAGIKGLEDLGYPGDAAGFWASLEKKKRVLAREIAAREAAKKRGAEKEARKSSPKEKSADNVGKEQWHQRVKERNQLDSQAREAIRDLRNPEISEGRRKVLEANVNAAISKLKEMGEVDTATKLVISFAGMKRALKNKLAKLEKQSKPKVEAKPTKETGQAPVKAKPVSESAKVTIEKAGAVKQEAATTAAKEAMPDEAKEETTSLKEALIAAGLGKPEKKEGQLAKSEKKEEPRATPERKEEPRVKSDNPIAPRAVEPDKAVILTKRQVYALAKWAEDHPEFAKEFATAAGWLTLANRPAKDLANALPDLVRRALSNGDTLVRTLWDTALRVAAYKFTDPESVPPATTPSNKAEPKTTSADGKVLHSDNNGRVQGMYDPKTGKATLFPRNIERGYEGGVLLHEVGVHMANSTELHKELAPVVTRAVQMVVGADGSGNRAAKRARKRLQDAGCLDKDGKLIPGEEEEALAYIVEDTYNDYANAPKSLATWCKMLFAHMKAWMYQHGWIGAGKLTEYDMVQIAKSMAQDLASNPYLRPTPEAAQDAKFLSQVSQHGSISKRDQQNGRSFHSSQEFDKAVESSDLGELYKALKRRGVVELSEDKPMPPQGPNDGLRFSTKAGPTDQGSKPDPYQMALDEAKRAAQFEEGVSYQKGTFSDPQWEVLFKAAFNANRAYRSAVSKLAHAQRAGKNTPQSELTKLDNEKRSTLAKKVLADAALDKYMGKHEIPLAPVAPKDLTDGITSIGAVDKALAKLPKEVQSITRTGYVKLANLLSNCMFTHDMVRMVKSVLPSAEVWERVSRNVDAETRRWQDKVTSVYNSYNALSDDEKEAVKHAVIEAVRNSAWGMDVGQKFRHVVKDASGKRVIDNDSGVSVYEELDYEHHMQSLSNLDELSNGLEQYQNEVDQAELVDQLSDAAREVYKKWLIHGQVTLAAEKQALIARIQNQYGNLMAAANEKDREALRNERNAHIHKVEDSISGNAPYSPFGRTGDHVVVFKSQNYLRLEKRVADAKAAVQGRSDIPKSTDRHIKELEHELVTMQSDPDNYSMEMVNGAGAAHDLAESLRQGKLGAQTEYFPAREFSTHYMPPMAAFERVAAMASNMSGDEFSKYSMSMKNAFADMATTLFIQSLSSRSALKSRLNRREVSGFNKDMMRSFIDQGNKMAMRIAHLTYDGELSSAVDAMTEEARLSQDRAAATRYLGYINRSIELRGSSASDATNRILRGASVWMLLTNPAFYIQNLTQPFMMSVPYIAGRFGYWRTAKMMADEMWEIRSKVKSNLPREIMIKNLATRGGKYDAGIAGMLAHVANFGLLDVGLAQDFGENQGRGFLGSDKLGHAVERLSGVARNVETINRAATAIVAYTLYRNYLQRNPSKVRRTGGNPYADFERECHEYVDRVLSETHGDYSSFNSPNVMKLNQLTRLATQFKKFSLIQLGMFTRLLQNSFRNTDKEVQAAARLGLAYALGTHFAAAGLLGTPIANTVLWAVAQAFGDPGDDDEDTIRKLIGDKEMADFVLRGVPKLLGVDMSEKVGATSLANPLKFLLPYWDGSLSDGKEGANALLVGLAGPAAGLFARGAEGVPYFMQGDYSKAVERLIPSGFANVAKAARFGLEGISTKSGDIMVPGEKVSWLDMVFQGAGLPSNTLTDRNALVGSELRHSEWASQQLTRIRRDYEKAMRAGDRIRMKAIVREDLGELNKARLKMGYTSIPAKQLLRAAISQRKREREAVHGIKATGTNREFLKRMGAVYSN